MLQDTGLSPPLPSPPLPSTQPHLLLQHVGLQGLLGLHSQVLLVLGSHLLGLLGLGLLQLRCLDLGENLGTSLLPACPWGHYSFVQSSVTHRPLLGGEPQFRIGKQIWASSELESGPQARRVYLTSALMASWFLLGRTGGPAGIIG